MTPNKQLIAEIEARVRKTIGPTFSSDGRESIEGRITKEDFEFLIASVTSWELIAKMNGRLAELTPTEQCATLEKALENEVAAHIETREALEQLKSAISH